MIHRATADASLTHPDSGVEVTLRQHQPIDDSDEYFRSLIRRYPDYFVLDNADVIEQASAAPGEKRRTKRG